MFTKYTGFVKNKKLTMSLKIAVLCSLKWKKKYKLIAYDYNNFRSQLYILDIYYRLHASTLFILIIHFIIYQSFVK